MHWSGLIAGRPESLLLPAAHFYALATFLNQYCGLSPVRRK